MRINLGCGRTPLPGWVNVDRVALDGTDVVADLDRIREVPLPFGDGSVEEILLSHVMEHLQDPLSLMEELYRVASPGCTCQVRVPYGGSDDAWEDPTHRRPYFLGSFGYFSQPYYWRADYGYRADWVVQAITLMVPRAWFQKHRVAGSTNPNWFQIQPGDPAWIEIHRDRNIVTEMLTTLQVVKPAREPKRELQTGFPVWVMCG